MSLTGFMCDICGASKKMGPHIYELTKQHRTGLWTCAICSSAHSDGISPLFEEKVLRILAERNTTLPKRLSNGLIPLG